jgi:hypothetical protein
MGRKIILGISILIQFLNIGCQAQNDKKTMEQIISDIKSQVKTCSETPVYTVQMNKQGCKMVLEMQDNVDYRMVEDNGESMMLPLNAMITKSGPQTAIVKIYPKDGEEFISKYAHVKLTFYHAPNKDSRLSDYKKITEFELPPGLEKKKLPYYETKIQFAATVPFDYSKELVEAKDLTSIPNIEHEVVKKYDEIRKACEKLDSIAYNKFLIHSSALVYNTTYTAPDQIEEREMSGGLLALVDPQIKNRQFTPIQNYVIQYYANGKIVALWQKNHNPLLYLKGEVSSKKEGDAAKPFEAGDPIFLYLPKNSEGLQVW